MPSPKKSDIGRKRRAEVTKKSCISRKRRAEVIESKEAFNYIPTEHYEIRSYIGNLSNQCPHCNAKKWKEETPAFCCANGEVEIAIPDPPKLINDLLTGGNSRSKEFINHIRSYNNTFAMTSIGCSEIRDGYMPTFKIQGQIYHRIGSLLPPQNESQKFLQIYFIGSSDIEVQRRKNVNSIVDANLLKELQKLMYTHNKYVKQFSTAYDKIKRDNINIDDVKVIIKENKIVNVHKGRVNAPVVEEVAVLMSGEIYNKRDIIVEGRSGVLRRINETHPSYDPLQYPILFPYGTDGYSIYLKQKNGRGSLSAMQFYKFCLMIRDCNHLLLCGDLLNLYVVDMYAKIETERALYIKLHQSKLRCEEYKCLKDSLISDSIENIGRLVVLPSSFVGSPRYMSEKAQDGLCYVRKFGTADLFVTFTCNPKWEEITTALINEQPATHRYDVVARVFKLKLGKLMRMVTKERIFGNVKCYMYSIEWQKRGLPHAHILLWLEERIKANEIDDIISAELPNPELYPKLFKIITNHMIHGPCGHLNRKAPCMESNNCTKRYPRRFTLETRTDQDGYPIYKRRSPQDGGFLVDNGSISIDNSWVVPYNPLLSHTFNAHINVEHCHSVKAIKYICKYICKGSDLATLSVLNKDDEVERYINGRYISTCEAFWRIFAFHIHDHSPTIVHLAVHLENGQRIYFNEKNAADKVVSPPSTTLTEFFRLCRNDDLAKTLLYEEVPSYFTWNGKKFERRKQGLVVEGFPGYYKTHAFGRVYTVHPSSRECFYLRMLLFKVRGPTSFKDLKVYNGITYTSFQAACNARGMLENDQQWINTLKEAVVSKHLRAIRQIFAIVITLCQPSNPLYLYEMFKKDMAEDILYRCRQECKKQDMDYNDDIFNECLILLNQQVEIMSNGKSVMDFGLPKPKNVRLEVSMDYLRETSYNIIQLQNYVDTYEPMLNADQLNAYHIILQNIEETDRNKLFFLDAPGGTGKTFLMNLLLSKIRSKNEIAIAVASSGIAATLLHGGRTVHSTFKLSINSSQTNCNIGKNTGLARVLQKCKLIIWDECSMSHKTALEAINISLQDIRNNNAIMGGITVLLAGDFRQTLPVIQRGTRADIVTASLKYSKLWTYVEVLPSLKTNMRLSQNSQEYADLLLQIGDGTIVKQDEKVSVKKFANHVSSIEELINKVWPDVENITQKLKIWIAERAILAPLNSSVALLNNSILARVQAEEICYYSIDSVIKEDDMTNYSTEFLNSLSPPGFPLHELKIKIGTPIMLLRNLDPPHLCNGTRLIATKLMQNVIQATILTGTSAGNTVLLPRIPLIPSDHPVNFKRLQFPVKLCFALTINKAQGQTFNVVGVDLTEECFTHGQLYVAASRVSVADHLYITGEKQTSNIVYTEVL